MADMNINVGANTRQAERDIQKLVNRNYNINLSTRGGAPLGRITGQVNEFTKSLDASNARVIAFGASAGIIFGVQRAFGALVTSVIETQKSLADINVILNVSTQNLQKFGGELFNIAKNTGQSFQDVAKAATEFSRQGLGVEETLKRTNEALILSRLSGLDAAKSVEALTAAVNSYASQAVTATEVVNKFANVDAAFAVSSADLAEALARVGSSAAQSGVGLNELIAIVTSAQQTTARGGAVIGNSFKTIFTRLQRTKVIDLLDNLGVNTKDSSGEIKSTINLLTDLAKVYDQLGTLEQAEVAEKVGGVFQINILKAALADLGKEYSIYNSALEVAGSTTDQAIRRNAELNKTYAAQLNALRENSQQAAAGIGQRVFGPSFDRVIGNANTILGGINESDGQGVGATLGKGILDGLGQVIAGPGLALIGGVFIKLFADLSKFASGSLKELLNLNNASKQQQALQQSVNQILQKNPDLFKLMSSGTAGLNKGAEILLNSLRAQTLELQKQQALSAQIAAQFIRTGGVRVVDGVPTAPTPGKPGKAAGYIPNFSATGGVSKRDAFAETIAAYQAGYEPKGVDKVDGKVYNKAESVVQFPGARDRGIVPPKDSPAGKQYQKDFKKIAGYDPYEYMEKGSAKGFIPNFAKIPAGTSIDDAIKLYDQKIISRGVLSANYPKAEVDKRLGVVSIGGKPVTKAQKEEKDTGKTGARLNSEDEYAAIVASPAGTIPFTQKGFQPQGKARDTFKGKGRLKSLDYKFKAYGVDSFEESKAGPSFEKIIQDNLNRAQQEIINKYSEAKGLKSSRITNEKSKSQVSSFAGFLFEDIIAGFLKQDEFDAYAKTAPDARFDFKPSKTIQDFFGIPSSVKAVEAKLNTNSNLMTSPSNTSSIANKIYAVKGGYSLATPTVQERDSFRKKQKAANGYIPNFAAISEVMALETAMSGEKAIFDTKPFPHVRNRSQPTFGSAMADHGGKKQALKDSLMGQKRAGLASGFIPHFAAEDTAPTDIGSSIAALTTQLGALAFMLSFSKGQYKTALAELTQSTRMVAKEQLKTSAALSAAGIPYQTGPGGFVLGPDSTSRQQEASRKFRENRAPFSAKAGAAIGSNAIAISLLGPILAETFSNALGKETKEARTGGALASGLGQAATFAGFGAMLTPGMPLLGAGIGAAAGGLLGLVDVIKQASTDIPELSAAAQKASENLTKINDAGQKVQTSFEQIQKLRESGQGEKAGQLENELLKLVQKEFRKTPEFVNEASTAIINQDFKSLQETIAKNTGAILENTIATQNRLAVQESLDKLSAQGRELRSGQRFKNEEEDLRQGKIAEIFDPLLSTGDFFDRKKFGLKEAENVQNILSGERMQKVISGEGFGSDFEAVIPDIKNLTESIGLDPKVAGLLFEEVNKESSQALLFLEYISNLTKQRVASEAATLRNTKEGNKVIAIITDTLQKVQSNYAILAKQSQESLDLDLFRDAQVRTSSTNMRVAETGSQAVVDELFGVITPTGKADKKTEAALIKINEDFSNGIQNSIDGVLSLIGSAFLEQNTKSFAALSEIGTGDGAQLNAEANLAAAESLALQFGENFNVEKFRDILAAGAVGEEGGFKIDEVLSKITEEFKIDTKDSENQKTLESIRQALFKTNQEVIKSQVVLREQKTILANQKFQENIRALITSIQGAFGGLSAFLTDDVTVTSGIQKALANINIIGEPTGEASTIEVGRNLARVNDEFNKLTGVNLNNVLGGAFVEKQTEARALDINKSLSPIISNIAKTLGPEAARKAANDLGARAGLTDKELKTLSIDQILARVSKTFAEVQIGTGKTNEALIQRAKDQLPEDLRGFLDGGGITSLEQVTVAQLSTANKTLTDILNAIQGGKFLASLGGNLTSSYNPTPDVQSKRRAAAPSMIDDASRTSLSDNFNNPDYVTVMDGASQFDQNPMSPRNFLGDGVPSSNIQDITKNNPDLQTAEDLIRRRPVRSYAKGYIPNKAVSTGMGAAMVRESIDIANGVGGALPTDRPEILRNFNGKTVVRGSGETVKKNYMGTGEDALLTRDMKKIPNLAEGYIPSDEIIQKIIRESNFDPDKIPEITEWLKAQGVALGSEKEFLSEIEDFKAGKAGVFDDSFSNKVIDKKLKRINDLKRLIADPAADIGERQTAQKKLDKMLAEISEELPKTGAATKNAGKAAGKGAAKGVAKGIGKGILKQIPVAGTLLGLGFAAYRLAQGDYIGAGLEASSTIPGLGIGSSAALIAYDMQKENESVAAQSYDNQQTAQVQQQNQKELLAEQPNVRREATKRREAKKVKPSVNMSVIPTALDFANAATRNIQQTQLNKQITTARTAKPTNPYKLIGGKGNAPATQIDRRTGTGTTVPKAESVKTSQPNAKFMMQSLVDAYTKSLSAQEGFYNRPTRETMDQKRALMAKVNEFKRLYEQGEYEALKTIYNKHQKSDPVKDAYASYKAKGIDPNAGYDAAMRAVGLNPETGAPDYSPVSQGSRINGRPAEEVLAEGRANRPSDPAYDAAMRAVGLNPETGAPDYSPVSRGSLIDGRPAQEVLDEMKKENANSRIQNYARGFVAEVNSGFDPDQVYPKRQPELQGLNNPQGDAYFNNVQEGTTAKERIAIGNRMMIPNLANSVPESSPVSVSLGGINISEAQTGGKTQDYAKELSSEIESRVGPLITQIKIEMDQKYGRAMEIVAAGERKGSLPRVPPKSRGLV